MEGAMKQISLSTSCGVEKSERVKKTILVVSGESGRDYPIPGLEGGRSYPHLDFHLVDLETGEIYLYYTPSLLQFAVPNSVVALDDFIYVFGSTPICGSESKELNSLQLLSHKEVFFGGACLHLSFNPSKTRDWYPALVPTVNRDYPRCISLMDKIYVFGSVELEPEVFDPAVERWKPLFPPPDLVGCRICKYALPDPSNPRIFLQLSGGQLPSPTIYAFTPEDSSRGGNWEHIPFDARDWSLDPFAAPPDWTNVAAVVDNIIYFHSGEFPSILRAFDLESGAWLIVSWESSFDDGLDMNQRTMNFNAMFPLGNKMLCLAVWTPIRDFPYIAKAPVKTEIVFREFRVEQSGATVKLFPLHSRSFILPATSQVFNFVPFFNSTSCRVEKSERVKESILVQSRESGRYYPIPGLEGGKPCRHADFHLVDLETNEIHLYHSPSLLQYAVSSSMVAVDDFIYVFGGQRPICESESEELNSVQPLRHKEVFFAAARLHLSSDPSMTKAWYPAPVPTVNPNNPRCISLMDKIYVFGSVKLEPEVLDPAVGHWEQLCPPSDLVGCMISNHALPDPSNRRILLHLSGGQLPRPTIYVFTPKENSSDGDWKPIPVVVPDWTPVAAVVDNVIYFYSPMLPSILRAFDLAGGAWLKVHWESTFEDGLDMNERTMCFNAMFPLGVKSLCLAAWTPIRDYPHIAKAPLKTEVVFRKFRVEQSDATVNLVPLSRHSFILPATSQVFNFLPV